MLGVDVGFNDKRVGAAVVGSIVGLAVGFGVIGAALGSSLRTTDGCVLNLRVGGFDACLLGGFVTSRVGVTDETLLGLEDGLMVGGAVTKDGANVGNVVGVIDSCNDGGSDEDAVGAGVEDDEKVSYKYTLPLSL